MARNSEAALPMHFVNQSVGVTSAIASMQRVLGALASEPAGQLARQGCGAGERSQGAGPASDHVLVRTAGRPARSRQARWRRTMMGAARSVGWVGRGVGRVECRAVA